MADQLAIALDNARLFAEVEARLDELSALHKHYTREAWAGFVQDRPRPEYRWQPTARPGEHESPSTVVWREVLDEARAPSHTLREHRPRGVEEGPVTRYDDESNQHVVAVPVRLREAVIGVLAFHRPRDAGAWQPEELAAIEAVATRLAFAAENLRLLEQTQRRAAQERLVDEISGKMQASLDPGTILKVAVREVGRALGASRSVVEIGGRDYSERGPGGNGGAVEEA
jgi:GAF domain-containing protein